MKLFDAVIINPSNKQGAYQGLSEDIIAIENPIWVGLMDSYLTNKGKSTYIVDCNLDNRELSEIAQEVSQYIKPKLVIIMVYGHNPNASTQLMPGASEIANYISLYNINQKSIMVGGHVSALPQRTLEEENVTFTCTGEGLITCYELLNAIDSVNPDFSKVPGLCFYNPYDQDEIITTPSPPLVTDLDVEIPGIRWDIFQIDKYKAHNWHCFGHIDERQPYAALYTTLGCPYHCTFCTIQSPFLAGEAVMNTRSSYRRWSPKIIGDGLEYLYKEHGIKNIKFADELFVLNKSHVTGICNEINTRGLKDLNIWAYARVDTTKDVELLDLMRESGIRWIALGIESANETVLKGVNKKTTVQGTYETVDRLKKADINIGANYIFGLPDDNLDTMEQTLNLAKEINAEYANFYCAMAYPGSALYQEAVMNKWNLPETWNGYSQYSEDSTPLNTKYLSGKEVLQFRDKAWQDYYNRDAYLYMIESKFGTETLNHVKSLIDIKLNRQQV